MKSETSRISHEQQTMKDKIKVHLKRFFQVYLLICEQENSEKIKVFKVLPYLVSTVVEVQCSPGLICVHTL